MATPAEIMSPSAALIWAGGASTAVCLVADRVSHSLQRLGQVVDLGGGPLSQGRQPRLGSATGMVMMEYRIVTVQVSSTGLVNSGDVKLPVSPRWVAL